MKATRFLLAGAVAVMACDSTADPENDFEVTAATVIGCYELAIGTWTPQPEEYMPPPVRFELTSEVGTDALENGRTLIGSRAGDPGNPYRWSWWQVTPDPKLQLIFSTGFTGVSLEFDRGGSSTFEGTARAFVDYSSEQPTAPATLTRRSCG